MSAFLLSTQILYTGLLVDLSRSAGGSAASGGSASGGAASGGDTSAQASRHWYSSLPLPSGKELSIFYWGCNVLYWNELSGQFPSSFPLSLTTFVFPFVFPFVFASITIVVFLSLEHYPILPYPTLPLTLILTLTHPILLPSPCPHPFHPPPPYRYLRSDRLHHLDW